MRKLVLSFILILTCSFCHTQEGTNVILEHTSEKTFKIDSIHSIYENYNAEGQTLKHVELRKGLRKGMYFEYYNSGTLKISGEYSQVIDTVSMLTEELLTGEITYSDEIIDYSPRKNGSWMSFDSNSRLLKLEKFSNSNQPYYSEEFNQEGNPFLKIRKNLNKDTVQNFVFYAGYMLKREFETVNDSLCGKFLEYYSNGTIETQGQFVLIPSEELTTIEEEDLLTGKITSYEVSIGMISQKHGAWSEYNESGDLIETSLYFEGNKKKR